MVDIAIEPILQNINFKLRDRNSQLNIKPIIFVSTLDTPQLNSTRRDGNTYRQVNYAIQKLFEGCLVGCFDHYKSGGNSRANIDLIDLVFNRLIIEHRFKEDDIIYDKNSYTLEFKNKNK